MNARNHIHNAVTEITELYERSMAGALDSISSEFSKAVYSGDCARQTIADAVTDPESIVHIHSRGEGYLGIGIARRAEGKIWELQAIGVQEDSRGQGVGSEIYHALLTSVAERGGEFLRIGAPVAQRFFRAVAGMEKNIECHGALRMPGIDAARLGITPVHWFVIPTPPAS